MRVILWLIVFSFCPMSLVNAEVERKDIEGVRTFLMPLDDYDRYYMKNYSPVNNAGYWVYEKNINVSLSGGGRELGKSLPHIIVLKKDDIGKLAILNESYLQSVYYGSLNIVDGEITFDVINAQTDKFMESKKLSLLRNKQFNISFIDGVALEIEGVSAIMQNKTNTPIKKNVNSRDNTQFHSNVLSTYTDCKGNPASAWVIVSPETFPEDFKGKYAALKFLVGEDSKPYNVELIEGSSEVEEWSKKALLMGKFPNKPSNCWMVKYEYKDGSL